jgi:DNA-binding beta-propeller fold protein YncE
MSEEDRLLKMSPDGQILVDKRFGSLGTIYDLHTDSQNNVWAAMSNGSRKFSPNGDLLATTPNMGAAYQFTVDSQDHPWVAAYSGVVKIGLDGQIMATFTQDGTTGYQGRNAAVDHTTGTVWVHNGSRPNQHGPSALVARFSTDGTFLGETILNHAAYNFNLLVHPDGHLWMFDTDASTHDRFTHLVRLAPDGTVKTRTPAGVFAGQMAVDPLGNVWLARGSDYNNLYKLSSEGTPLGVNTINENNGLLAPAPDGSFWVHSRYKVHKFAP